MKQETRESGAHHFFEDKVVTLLLEKQINYDFLPNKKQMIHQVRWS
jgi:hypothetical protein